MSPSLKYTSSYLLSKGYKCHNEIGEPVEFDYFFSSLVSGKMFVIFKKGNISVQYGLYIKGHPPKTHIITINGKCVYDMHFEVVNIKMSQKV